jgi:hypothetical protein
MAAAPWRRAAVAASGCAGWAPGPAYPAPQLRSAQGRQARSSLAGHKITASLPRVAQLRAGVKHAVGGCAGFIINGLQPPVWRLFCWSRPDHRSAGREYCCGQSSAAGTAHRGVDRRLFTGQGTSGRSHPMAGKTTQLIERTRRRSRPAVTRPLAMACYMLEAPRVGSQQR